MLIAPIDEGEISRPQYWEWCQIRLQYPARYKSCTPVGLAGECWPSFLQEYPVVVLSATNRFLFCSYQPIDCQRTERKQHLHGKETRLNYKHVMRVNEASHMFKLDFRLWERKNNMRQAFSSGKEISHIPHPRYPDSSIKGNHTTEHYEDRGTSPCAILKGRDRTNVNLLFTIWTGRREVRFLMSPLCGILGLPV